MPRCLWARILLLESALSQDHGFWTKSAPKSAVAKKTASPRSLPLCIIFNELSQAILVPDPSSGVRCWRRYWCYNNHICQSAEERKKNVSALLGYFCQPKLEFRIMSLSPRFLKYPLVPCGWAWNLGFDVTLNTEIKDSYQSKGRLCYLLLCPEVSRGTSSGGVMHSHSFP